VVEKDELEVLQMVLHGRPKQKNNWAQRRYWLLTPPWKKNCKFILQTGTWLL